MLCLLYTSDTLNTYHVERIVHHFFCNIAFFCKHCKNRWYRIAVFLNNCTFAINKHCLLYTSRLDGVSELGIFFRIYLPCMKSTFSCGTIIAFSNAWNSYQWAHLIMYDDQKIPMTVFLTLGLKGNSMTLVLLSMVPSLVVFFIFQKFFVEGMNGALK